VTKTVKLATVKGSANAFADLGRPDAELRQLKVLLAAEIVRTLNDRDVTVRQAEAITGTAAADFSRLKGADLSRFTVDRLVTALGKLAGAQTHGS
jgi:predicted XRE-type DNA-binding protein